MKQSTTLTALTRTFAAVALLGSLAIAQPPGQSVKGKGYLDYGSWGNVWNTVDASVFQGTASGTVRVNATWPDFNQYGYFIGYSSWQGTLQVQSLSIVGNEAQVFASGYLKSSGGRSRYTEWAGHIVDNGRSGDLFNGAPIQKGNFTVVP